MKVVLTVAGVFGAIGVILYNYVLTLTAKTVGHGVIEGVVDGPPAIALHTAIEAIFLLRFIPGLITYLPILVLIIGGIAALLRR